MAKEEKEDRKNARKAKKEARTSAKKVVSDNKQAEKIKSDSLKEEKKSARKSARNPKKGLKVALEAKDYVPQSYSIEGKQVFDFQETNVPKFNGNADVQGEVATKIINTEKEYNKAKEGNKLGEAAGVASEELVNDVNEQKSALKKTIESRVEETEDGEGTRATDEGAKPYIGDGSKIGEVARDGDGQYDADGISDQDWYKMVGSYNKNLNQDKSGAPSAAIEAMGIQHYFPPQQDIATANFTGRYTGSRTLVSAADALYPAGLMDARKRAVEAKAKSKALEQEKYWELTDTAPQYDVAYKEVGMEMLEKYGEASNWDLAALAKSKSKLGQQFRKDMYDYKARGKYLLELDGRVKTLSEKWTDGDEYVPPEMKRAMMDFRTAAADMGPYMRGEAIGDKQIQSMANMFRSYESYTPHMNKQLERMQGMGAEEQLLAPGTDFNDMNFAANAATAVEDSKDANWTLYRKAMIKYYDVDKARTIVEGIYQDNELWEGMEEKDREAIINASTRTLIAHLPTKIDIQDKFVDRKTLGWKKLALKEMEYERQSEWRKEEWESYYTEVNNGAQDLEPGAIASINARSTVAGKREALSQYYADNDKKPVNVGGIVMAEMPVSGEKSVSIRINGGTLLVGVDGNAKTLDDELAYLAKHPTAKSAKQIKGLTRMKEVGSGTQNVASRGQGYGQWSTKTQSFNPIENSTGAATEDASKVVAYRVGKVAYGTGIKHKGKEVGGRLDYDIIQVNPIGSDSDQRALSDDETGSQENRNRAYTTGNAGGTSSSSGSSSSK